MSLTVTEEALVRQLLDQQAALLSLATSESTIISKLGATKVTIADLTNAPTISDADLFLIRQGTTEKNVTGAVVKSLASSAVAGATETVAGIVELATSAETITGTDNSRAVHPAGLASLTATETRSGLIELATAAEAQALTDAVRALSPAGLASAFGGANKSFTASGYQKLPSGLIIQWGLYNESNAYMPEAAKTITLPIAFPTAALGGSATARNSAQQVTGGSHAEIVSISTTQMVLFIQANAAVTTNGIYWTAIGH